MNQPCLSRATPISNIWLHRKWQCLRWALKVKCRRCLTFPRWDGFSRDVLKWWISYHMTVTESHLQLSATHWKIDKGFPSLLINCKVIYYQEILYIDIKVESFPLNITKDICYGPAKYIEYLEWLFLCSNGKVFKMTFRIQPFITFFNWILQQVNLAVTLTAFSFSAQLMWLSSWEESR